ncbi:MAG: hypothetical protein GY940_33890, partial [bacterium]|nr:hypothetical protein [bacterium]
MNLLVGKGVCLPWKMDAHGTDHTMPFILPMGKEVDKKRLETVLKQSIHPHEGLRTSFLMVAEHPVQPVHDDVPFPLDDVKPGPDAPGYGGAATPSR